MQKSLTFRYAEQEDIPALLQMIKELAEYEHLLDEVVATPELLKTWLFEKKSAEVLLAEVGGDIVGYALFFHNFSTFLGRAGIYLEDLYIRAPYRKNGYGKAMLQKLAAIAVQRGCGRLEWSCLDWNQPSIDFYLSMSAQPMQDWTVYRLTGEGLTGLAGSKPGRT